MNPWRPEPFQGGARRKSYFEGWYFKQVSADLSRAWAFIPGISLPDEGRGCAFVQAIDGGTGRTWWFEYPLEEFEASSRELRIRVGKSEFSAAGIALDLGEGESRIAGELRFGPLEPLPFRLLSPNAMGPFSFAPLMECKHGLVSLDHAVEGSFSAGGAEVELGGGRGYIEKDWGSSMPESWIWTQSNSFAEGGDSFMLSIARVPWLGGAFTGFLCLGSLGGRLLREASYTGARIEELRLEDDSVELALGRGPARLELRAARSRGGLLRAPSRGSFDRRIAESVDARLSLRWSSGGETLFEGSSELAGLELVGDPAALLRGLRLPSR